MRKYAYLQLSNFEKEIADWLFQETIRQQERDPIVNPKDFNENLFEHFCHQIAPLCPSEERVLALFLEDIWRGMQLFDFSKTPLLDRQYEGKSIKQHIKGGIDNLETTRGLLSKVLSDSCPKSLEKVFTKVIDQVDKTLAIEKSSWKEITSGGPKIEMAEMEAVFLLHHLFNFTLTHISERVPGKILSFYPQGLEKVSSDDFCKVTSYRLIMNLAATTNLFLSEQVVRKRFKYTNNRIEPVSDEPYAEPNNFPRMILEGARKEMNRTKRKKRSA